MRAPAYYSAAVDQFLRTDPRLILGALATAHSHDLEIDQRRAWEQQIDLLTAALIGLDGTLYLEFDIPRFIATKCWRMVAILIT